MKTETIKINEKNVVSKAVDALREGKIIIYPTETCYGIGVDATNDEAVLNVIKIKKRDMKKKISIAVSDIRMAKRYLIITKEAEKVAGAFMPGPITLIVESRDKDKIGFRIVDNKFVRDVIKKLGKPITTTSANISDELPIYDTKKLSDIFEGKVDIIIDAGKLPKIKPSTVYDVADRKILRKGPVSEKEISQLLML